MNQFALSVSPLAVMLFVGSITPGPNNIMLMLAGTKFGFAPTIPHMLGVSVGAVLVICLTFAGLGALMLGHPFLLDFMTAACGLYLLWMAKKIMTSPAPGRESRGQPQHGRPMRFVEAVMFQFVNPKVWVMAVAAASIAARFPFPPAVSVVVVGLTAALVNTPCIALWAAFGDVMRHRLEDAATRRVFDGSMSALVLATALWIVWPLLTRPFGD